MSKILKLPPKGPRGRPFKKGEPRPAKAGRKKGTPNRVTRDLKEFIQDVVSDVSVQEAVRDSIRDRDKSAMAGFLGLAAHAIGRPKETVELSASPSLAKILLLAAEARAGSK
jgi:hypothetical protein